jgi:hypothetical protein
VIARIQKHLANEIERLLRAAGDEHVIGRYADPVATRVAGNHLA